MPASSVRSERDALAHAARQLVRPRARRTPSSPKRSNSGSARAPRLARGARPRSSSASAALSSAERHGSSRSRCGISAQRAQALGRRVRRPSTAIAPARRLLEAADQLEQRRLAAAGRADDARAPRPARTASVRSSSAVTRAAPRRRTPSQTPASSTRRRAGAGARRCEAPSREPRSRSCAAPFAGITPQVRRVSAGRACDALRRYLSPLAREPP